MPTRTPDDHRHGGPRHRAHGGLDAVRQRFRRFAFRTTLGPALGAGQPEAHTPRRTER